MTGRIGTLAIVAALLGGCAGTRQGGAPEGAQAEASLMDKDGQSRGTATFSESAGGLAVSVSASGLAPGPKGLHLHMVGKCDGPEFTTAGGHWNPASRQHGTENPQGPHMGDIPNIEIGVDGTGRAQATIAGATLRGGSNPVLDADGTAIIIHAGADDYRSDPAGNSGARIACGVIQAR